MADLRGRDSMGRFVNGNVGGPGRRPRQVEQEYLQTMEEITDSEAWKAIVQRAVTDAIAGDSKARNWLSGYLLGMPGPMTPEEPETDSMTQFIADIAAKMKEEDSA